MSQIFRCELYKNRVRIRQLDSILDDLSLLNMHIGMLLGPLSNHVSNVDENYCITIRLIQKPD